MLSGVRRVGDRLSGRPEAGLLGDVVVSQRPGTALAVDPALAGVPALPPPRCRRLPGSVVKPAPGPGAEAQPVPVVSAEINAVPPRRGSAAAGMA